MLIPPYYRSHAGYAALMDWHERAFSGLGIRWESMFLATHYGETYVAAAGDPDAPPVVLLHGVNTNAAVWRPQLAELSREFRVYAPDIVGFAGRSASARLPYRGDAYGRWAEDVLDALDVDAAHLVGSSAGGFFALKLAAFAPERVRTLALLNACGLAPYRFPYNLTRLPAVTALLNHLTPRYFASPEMARRLVRKTIAPQLPLDNERVEFSELILQHYRRYGPPGLLPAAELHRITAPVLLLYSENEMFTEPSRAIERAHQHIADLEAEIVSGAGHDMNIDRDSYVNARLTDFFTQGDEDLAAITTSAFAELEGIF